MLTLGYNWIQLYTDERSLKKDLGIHHNVRLPKQGWYVTASDSLLIETMKDERLRVMCWNTPKARDELLKTIGEAIGLPVKYG